jgi:hypothetical protein
MNDQDLRTLARAVEYVLQRIEELEAQFERGSGELVAPTGAEIAAKQEVLQAVQSSVQEILARTK